MHTAFHMPHVYDYITKLCRQAGVIQNHENENKMFATLAKVKPDRKYKRLKLGGGHVYDRSSV
jgi:hypothetical protein